MPVYDRSYRRWDGEFLRRPVRWLPIWSNGVRLAFRSKGSPFRTVMFYGFLFVTLVPFLILFLLNFLFFFPPEFISKAFAEFLEEVAKIRPVQYVAMVHLFVPRGFLMIVTVIFGAGLIAKDRAASALPLYLSRPMTRLDYIFGKWFVVAFFLACLTLFPSLLLWLFVTDLHELGAIFQLCTALIALYATTILALSALCRRPMVAGLIWFAWVMVTGILGAVISFQLDSAAVLALSPQHCIGAIAQHAFDLSAVQEVEGGSEVLRRLGLESDLPVRLAWLSLVAHVLAGCAILFRSLRAADVTLEAG
jgi:ABC-2 type transport system permease protein